MAEFANAEQRLREEAHRHTETIARHQDEREASMRAVLASAATYIALTSAAITGRATSTTQLRAGQFLLSLLFAAVLAYYATAIYQRSRDIADDGVRRLVLELEHEGAVTERERRAYSFGTRDWRRTSRLPLPVLAALPRWGKSLQLGLLLLLLCGILPAAWFSFTTPRAIPMDTTVVIATAGVVLLCVRVMLAGCRHWFWVHAKDLTLRASPNKIAAPAWRWWLNAAREPAGGPRADLTGRAPGSRASENSG